MGYSPDLGNQDLRSLEHRGDVIYRAQGFHDPPTAEERARQRAIKSGSEFEAFTGGLAAITAIIGLASYFPIYMGSIATIAIGFALIAQGGALASRWQNVATATIPRSVRYTESVGIGTEVLGGFAGMALGVLALLGVAPLVLLPVAAIVVGAALLFGGPAQPQLADAVPHASQRFRRTRETLRTSSSVMVTAGLAGVVLGVLGLTLGGYALVLALVAMLAVALALVVAGGVVTKNFGRRRFA